MTDPATILHADLDAFYASVEQRQDPRLRDRPMAVGTGVILAVSYAARDLGVRKTMTASRAREICPELVLVPPRMELYSEASRDVYAIFHDTVPVVEALSIDEAFLETAGMERIAGSPERIARELRRRVREEVGLTISIGVARTKFLAKVASGESKPDGLLVVPPERETAFLHPLPVERLWGVGRVTTAKLQAAGVLTVGDLARISSVRLRSLLGPTAADRLIDLAANRDPRPVEPRRRRRSIGAQSAFAAGSRDFAEVESLAASLTDRVCRRLRSGERACRTVTVGLRFGDYSRATRSRTFDFPTDRTDQVRTTARALLRGDRELIEERGLTLISVSVGGLETADAVQTTLAFGESGPGPATAPGRDRDALDTALDQVRRRFGETAIRRASGLGGEAEIAAPVLPDREA